ncbi:MAG: type II secretion system protein [Candidatus Cloacimonadaceae bacterium]|jgi:prepilin-type N-terminal cleavage/methylation domain-containing protein|nr:type II secretion system GspH family protein [Candidatus Cloacimonadota bacterium]MDX9949286.1 type II secretion system protein [Candidatus Syntrophosphaera sp.]NLN85469.1 type II secretion system protein [Candidatus Cloacimonadota bacterium]
MMNSKGKFKNSLLGRQRGVTLTELIVVMAISSLLILVSALGIGIFFRKYKELTAWANLQNDALDCINQIKNGVPVGSEGNIEYFGVINAMELKLTNTTTNSSTGLMITPPSESSTHTQDFAHFYLYDGAVRCNYSHHGVQVASPLYLFPKKEDLNNVIVDKFLFTKVNNHEDREILVLQLELNARVKTGEDRYREVKFKTKMAKK